jgi:hypothetical protein
LTILMMLTRSAYCLALAIVPESSVRSALDK